MEPKHSLKYYKAINYIKDYLGGMDDSLDFESEKILSGLAKSGDSDAWLKLLRSNIPLLASGLETIWWMAETKEVSMQDVIPEVVRDMQKRFDKHFDPEKGYRLGTFIFSPSFIRWRARFYVQEYSKGSVHQHDDGFTSIPLPKEEERESSHDEWLYRVVNKRQKELPTPADYASLNLDRCELRPLINKLDERSRKIVEDVYFGFKNYHEIGRELNFSAEYIRLLHNKAIKKLRLTLISDVSLEELLKENGK